MEINSNFSSQPLPGAHPPQTSRASQQSQAASDTTAFGQAATLETQLSGEPGVRGEAVARAQQLIADPDWPSSKIMGQVAQTLAKHISQAV